MSSSTTSGGGVGSGAEDTIFFASAIEYKSSKPGYIYLKDGARGPGYYIPFFASKAYNGKQPGYGFKMDSMGLGYYLFGYPKSTNTEECKGPAAIRVKQKDVTFIDVPDCAEGAKNDDDEEEEEEEEGTDDAAKEGGEENDDFDTMRIADCYCRNCGESGTTNMMRINTPFFGELIVSSFQCNSCGFKDTKTEPVGDIMEKGVKLELTVTSEKSLNRRIITTKYTSIGFPELQLEIPPTANGAGGRLTTIEGIVQEATVKLHEGNKYRKGQLAQLDAHLEEIRKAGKEIDERLVERGEQERTIADKVDEIVRSLCRYAKAETLPFCVTIDDPAGLAAIENPNAPAKDPECVVKPYTRTKAQDNLVGVFVQADAAAVREHEAGVDETTKSGKKSNVSDDEISKMFYDSQNSDVRFASPCVACGKMGETRMAITKIPNFSEIIMMCFVCEACGFKDAEVKPGGEIEAKGKTISLKTTLETIEDDLKRDVLKSNDASIKIDEIGFESQAGTLGAVYTTVEGLLSQTLDNLKSSQQFTEGDSATDTLAKRMRDFIAKFENIVDGNVPFTLTIRDPSGQSWVYSPCAPKPDPQIKITHFERTDEDNEILGLDLIDTAECDAAEAAAEAAASASKETEGA